MANSSGIETIWLQQSYVLDRRTWVYYLTLTEALAHKWAELLKVAPEKEFYENLERHVEAYVHKGVEPPEMIASAVMNVADDFMNGREIVIRAGDYIALQNHMRQGR